MNQIFIKFIIKMKFSPYSTEKKSNFMPTSFKTDKYDDSASQKDPQTIRKSIVLSESQTNQLKNRGANMFSEDRKENDNIFTKLTSRTFTQEQLELIGSEHRMEIEKLLLEISRLHDVINDQEKSQKYEIQRLKEDFEYMNHLQITNLKQSHHTQTEILESQIRKMKEVISTRNEEYEELQKSAAREKENLLHENVCLKADLKQVLENKNSEIFSLKERSEKQIEKLTKEKEESIEELKTFADKEMNKVLKKLKEKERDFGSLKNEFEKKESENMSLQKKLENDRHDLEEKIKGIVEENQMKQSDIMDRMGNIVKIQIENSEEEMEKQKQTYESQIQNLFALIQIKDKENERNVIFNETQKMQAKYIIQNLQRELSQVKNQLYKSKTHQLQEIQSLKVKMALMHENDLKSMVALYETKIEGISRQVKTKDEEVSRMEDLIKVETEKRFQMKKGYDITVSKLTARIIELKNGMDSLEKNVKDKVQNEKSMMMITSQQLLKDNQLKNENVKFYEEELRKLRQLLQIQANQVQESERNVEEKIKLAEDELNRLSNKILQIKGESQISQKKYKITIEEKNKQIDRLNQLLLEKSKPEQKNEGSSTIGEEMLRLEEILSSKEDQIRMLKGNVQDVNERIVELRAQNERLYIESQINTEDAKKHFKALADKNLVQLKKFYQKRLKELEEDKRQLQKINTSQTERITQLVLKYKELQKALKEIMRQSKKRGELQEKIIQLGTDTNLVKNMSELFHK